MFYSKQTGGFYAYEIHGDNIPADAVEITKQEYADLLDGQAAGKRIVANQSGHPIIQDQPTIPISASVTALQGLLAIDQSGLAAAYELWAHDPARTFAQKAFINKAQTWKRDDQTLADAAASLGLTEAQVDGLFTLAATL